MTNRPLMFLVAAALATGCAYRPTPIPLRGTADDLTPLRGDWTGVYTNSQTGRSGTITFALDAAADIAYGEVVMSPGGPTVRLRKSFDESSGSGAAMYVAPRLLTIAFASISGGQVSGSLDAYQDADCRCTIKTTFTGKLSKAGVLEGTYRSSGSAYLSGNAGTWRVTRTKH